MTSPSHPEKKKDKRKSIGRDDSFYARPDVILLDEEHWAYIRRRYHMSPRELQVAELVCRGFSNEEIAKDLKIRQGTVKTHLRNIYRRIRVKNKIAMLLKLVDQAAKFSVRSKVTPPLPIVAIIKPVKKTPTPAEIRKKEK
ncbi:MAG: response regulator transcription factor [Planctomycetota bacterium]|jgi:DNA-binding NarL/FixJ family response regulator